MEGYQGNYQNGNFREVDFQFQRLAQNIGTNIQKILQNVSSIQRMISQIGTPQDNQQLQDQVQVKGVPLIPVDVGSCNFWYIR
jgi:syntaxin 7